MKAQDSFYARICWNTKGWQAPSGDAAKLERNSYVSKRGFGHEEWLFNFARGIVNGYQYAFLQGVHNSFRTMTGKAIRVLLWAIDSNGNHVHVGEITNCEVLTNAQQRQIFTRFKTSGQLNQMKQEVQQVGGGSDELEWDGLFNVRFRRGDVVQHDPLPVAPPADKISRLKRYGLTPVLAEELKQRHRSPPSGSASLPKLGSYIRRPTSGTTVDPYHPLLQRELMKLLADRFGARNVKREDGYVDLKVTSGNRTMLIEIKTASLAKQAIREALGQILEYAYCVEQNPQGRMNFAKTCEGVRPSRLFEQRADIRRVSWISGLCLPERGTTMFPVERDGKADAEQEFLQDLAEYFQGQAAPIEEYEFSEEDVSWLKQFRIGL